MIASPTSLIVGISVLLCMVLALVGMNRAASAEDILALTHDEQEAYWQQQIETRGAAAAYADFSHVVSALSYTDKHEQAHLFGKVLYLTTGSSGLSVCDSQFSFGCFHEFLGRAIYDHGIASVPELNQACVDALGPAALSCQHGIGHGVQSYFGYDRKHLNKSLAVCRDLPFSDPIGGCYGGVFMEYNMRTMLAEQAEPRELVGDTLAPCNDFDTFAFKRACIYWQAQWWRSALFERNVAEEEYAIMGSYCESFIGDDPELRRACYEGIGNITAIASNFEPERAKELCDAVSSEPVEQLLCRSTVANHLGIEVSHAAGEQVCDDLSGEVRAYCRAYAHNEANVAKVWDLPELQ